MFRLFSILALALMVLASSQMMGGWSKVEKPNENQAILGAANFGAGNLFPNLKPVVRIISAEQQVVAGMSYNLQVAVTRNKHLGTSGKKTCSVIKMKIWDQAWRTPRYQLASNVTISSTCPKPKPNPEPASSL